MKQSKIVRWTREGILDYQWNQFENFEALVIHPSIRQRLTDRIAIFSGAEEQYAAHRIPWRYGLFFYGPPGSGKSAASRGIAQLLGWNHFTIPAHEILDAHLLEKAIHNATQAQQKVIILEDIDQMIRSMETETFFMLLDHAMERSHGCFWVGTSRSPETVPKTQLLRPGRLDESFRFNTPNQELRATLLSQIFKIPKDQAEDLSEPMRLLHAWVETSEHLSFSHFEELRQLVARSQIEGNKIDEQNGADSLAWVQNYIDEQGVTGDRWGGLSSQTELLRKRVEHLDARVLMAALDMTDVFRKLIEKVISDAFVQKTTDQQDGND